MSTVLVFQDSAFSYVTSNPEAKVSVRSVLIRSHKPANLDGKLVFVGHVSMMH